MLTAVTGINWGDEGKGRAVSYTHLTLPTNLFV